MLQHLLFQIQHTRLHGRQLILYFFQFLLKLFLVFRLLFRSGLPTRPP